MAPLRLNPASRDLENSLSRHLALALAFEIQLDKRRWWHVCSGCPVSHCFVSVADSRSAADRVERDRGYGLGGWWGLPPEVRAWDSMGFTPIERMFGD